MLSQRMRKRYNKTLGTSVINSAMSLFLCKISYCIERRYQGVRDILQTEIVHKYKSQKMYKISERERGQCGLFITWFLIRWLSNFGDFWLVDNSLSLVNCLNFQWQILIYRRGIFVYHHLGCILIYWPLSYPFRSLINYVLYNKIRIQIFLYMTYLLLAVLS